MFIQSTRIRNRKIFEYTRHYLITTNDSSIKAKNKPSFSIKKRKITTLSDSKINNTPKTKTKKKKPKINETRPNHKIQNSIKIHTPPYRLQYLVVCSKSTWSSMDHRMVFTTDDHTILPSFMYGSVLCMAYAQPFLGFLEPSHCSARLGIIEVRSLFLARWESIIEI